MTRPNKRLRVLIVDDSALQRRILIDLLGRDPELEVAGSAANGAEALREVERLRPDVVTLDERMPVMSGLETARRIMRDCPTPIVLVTSAGGMRARDIADAALSAGVLAVQDKRGLAPGDTAAASELLRVVKGMATVRLVRRRRDPGAPPAAHLVGDRKIEIIAIGASTGGPQVLRTIVSRLPADFPVPVLIVQHTTAGYSHALVEWLRAETALPVALAEHGQPLKPGVYVAPTEHHLVVEGRRLALSDADPCSLHRPSATVLFRSVARAFGRSAAGVLLTGMGDDGAAGLKELRDMSALTIAQDEASCVVFGMPAQAIRLGAAEHVLAPEQIAALLLEQTHRAAA